MPKGDKNGSSVISEFNEAKAKVQVQMRTSGDNIEMKETNQHLSLITSDRNSELLFYDIKCLDTVLNGLVGRRFPTYFGNVQEAIANMTGRKFTMVKLHQIYLFVTSTQAHLNAILEYFPSAFTAEWKIPDVSRNDPSSYELHIAINPLWPPFEDSSDGKLSGKLRARTESRIAAFRYAKSYRIAEFETNLHMSPQRFNPKHILFD